METQQAVSRQPDTKDNGQKASNRSAFAVVISLVSVITAICSLWLSIESNQSGERMARANAYLQLREYFNRVAIAIPLKYYADNAVVPAKDTEDRVKIQNYWYLTFDEWYVTTQLNDRAFQKLWDDYYQYVVAAMLDKPVPHAVVCDLINDKLSKNPIQTDYAKVLDDLYAKKHPGEHLCNK